FYALLEQVLVDVEQACARKDLVELVALELIQAGAAGHDHRADIEIVERGGEAVKQYAVLHDDALALVRVACGGLRIAAAQVAGRQHALRADLVEHRLGGEPDLREEALRAAARKIEHRIGVLV